MFWSCSGFPALHQPFTNLLDLRRYPVADRPGICLLVLSRPAANSRSLDRFRSLTRRLLGGVCSLPAARYPPLTIQRSACRKTGLCCRTGFAAHWNKNSNFAWAFDTWFLNLFPSEHRFLFNDGGYSTLSFIPDLGTMVLGLIVGEVLRSPVSPGPRSMVAIAGVIGLIAGNALGWLGICPVVKRIWTPSWTLYSGGWCCLLMAGFYLVIDLWVKKAWCFPLVVVGMNSIAAYCSDHLFDNFFSKNRTTHLGPNFFGFLGAAYEPLLHGAATLLVGWLVLFWMYRRKIFLRI